jgi:hypothetical protein
MDEDDESRFIFENMTRMICSRYTLFDDGTFASVNAHTTHLIQLI